MTKIRYASSAVLAVLLSVPLVLVHVAPAEGARTAYKKGTNLRIEGQIVGPDGHGVADALVVLTAERRGRRLLNIGGDDREPVSVQAKSDARGTYAFDWNWDAYHDTFALDVVLRAHGDRPREILSSFELTELLTGENPVRATIEVSDPSLIRFTSRLDAGDFSDDEQRVLGELGRPGRYAEGDATSEIETEWWYFERGRMYRFEAGALAQVVHFEPVLPEE